MGSIDDSKVVIVTGAVSGIGEALTRDFVTQGKQVVGFDIQDDIGKALEQELGSLFFYVHCDCTSYEEQAAAFQTTFDKFGRIDAFCHNAGLIDRSSIYLLGRRGSKEIPPKPDINSTETCWHGLIYGTQLSVHFMRQNPTPGGCIVATGSSVGIHPIESMPEYCGVKAAINNFVRGTAAVLKLKDNIRINCVNPGAVATRNIPQAMRISFDGYMTPIETIVKAYNKVLDDESLNGELLESSKDQTHHIAVPEYSDGGEGIKFTTTVYDGLFVYLHGEKSGLPGAIQ